MFVPLLFL